MGVRATFSIETSFGGLTEVELHSAGYGGAVRALTTQAGDTLQHNYDNLNPETIYETPIIKSRVNCTVMIRDATDRAVIDEIIAANEGQFTLKYDKGGSDFWQGDIVPYLGDIAVRSYPYPVRLTAKDFTPLNGIIYPLSDERKPIIEVIAEIMELMGYELPITTATSWVNSGQSNTARDFLGQIYIDTKALRQYATREEDEDRPILAITALELLCRNFKIFAKQTEGRLYLEQKSAYDTPTSVLRTLYDKDGTFVSASNVNTTVSAPNASPYRQISVGSTESFNPAYKRVSYTFNHRQRLQGIVFPSVFRLPEGGLTSREFTQFFEPDGIKAITVTSYASLGYLVASTETPFARVQVKSGSYYFNRITGQWTTTPYINEFTLVPTQLFGEGRVEPTISWVGQVNISTSPVPVAGGNITVTFYSYVGGTESVIAYSENAFSITGEEEAEIGESVQYQLEQTGNYSVNYDDGFVIYGDGPQQYSSSALRTGLTVDAWTQGGWYRRGNTTDWDFSELFTREIMEFQVSFVRNLEARLVGDYSPSNTLVYDNTNFFFIGGGWSAYTGEWNANFVANTFASATATLTTNLITGNIGLGTGIYTSIANAVNQSLESGGLIAYRLAVQLDPGAITQLTCNP